MSGGICPGIYVRVVFFPGVFVLEPLKPIHINCTLKKKLRDMILVCEPC